MPAFDALENRALELSLRGSQDNAEAVVVVGLFTSSPPETHDGKYGQNGEPASVGAGGTGYRRSRARFTTASTVNGTMQCVNTEPVVLTGLPAGTYTHFAIFGSTSAGQVS